MAKNNISKGEEVLISYIGYSIDIEEGHKDLKKRYGFDCHCNQT